MSGSNHTNIYLFHIIIVAPLLIYLGLCKNCNEFIKKITLILGITVLVYHLYKINIVVSKGSEKYTEEVITSNNIV
jgi:hypothetical protein